LREIPRGGAKESACAGYGARRKLAAISDQEAREKTMERQAGSEETPDSEIERRRRAGDGLEFRGGAGVGKSGGKPPHSTLAEGPDAEIAAWRAFPTQSGFP